MAVKGKSRSGAAPGAPKPKIEPKKPPLTKRPGFRKGAVVGLVLLLLVIGVMVAGRVSRSSDLRAYDRSLTAALRPFQKHMETGAATNLADNVTQMAAGELPARRITELSDQWQKDFTAARDALGRLDPPDELALANTMYAHSMDDYVTVARLAGTLSAERRLAARAQGGVRRAAQAQVSALQSLLQEWQSRADQRRGEALAAINALKADWGIGGATA